MRPIPSTPKPPWGWSNGALSEGTYYFDIFAGAGQCDRTKGALVGLLTVDYDGTVYGGGVNLLYATERWFVAWNNTWTDADISGDFDSSVTSFISQPRIGLIRGSWMGYVGGMYLDTEETHKGDLDLGIPGLGAIPFSVELDNMDEWNYAVGVAYVFSPKAHLSLEIGFGDRDHTLFNYTYRF